MSEKQKLNFDVPVELHKQIQEQADREDRSMASWIRRAIEAALESAAR